ncbi:restriction endonuclease subunit S [Agathobacter rectalis]|uniref:restriction endonuclease subunit S n=1 Tax=Agathobacter rectalis TaxID=39491 RepID=UPI0027D21522|nr:restriction endonuclease subunit S [Agathobacter rectalis]MCB7109316.1 restriction endonuclease subunit S [Agathobacter rectalis]MCG4812456.1 restriction endonuclease subunit S [Agathobacter rectalis]
MRVKLKDIFDLQMGKTPSRSNLEYWNTTDYKWISIADLTKTSKYIFETKEYLSKSAIKDSGIKVIPANTVVMSFKLSIGKTAITKEDMYSNEAIMAFKDKHVINILPEYIFYLFKYKNWEEGSNKAVMGKTLNKATLSEIEVEICSIEKQRQIVSILDKIMSSVDGRKQELQLLDELIKARFVEMFGDPRSNPFGFEKKRLKDTCKVITGNTPSRAIEEYYGDYIEWIKTDNIVSGILNPTQATESLSEKGMNVGRTVEKDSILMACIAGSIASIGRVCITDRTVAFNQQINAVVPEQYNILFLYVLFQMSKDYLVEDINMALKGILSKSKLEEKEFIIPPMDLQEQFSDFVKQVDKSKVDTMTFAPIYAIINLYLHTHFYQGGR